MKCCRQVLIERSDNVFGVDISFEVQEPGFAAIIPVAIEFNERTGHNIMSCSSKTTWYKGPTLIDAIRNQANELATV